jgi:hypothetical protein
MAAGELSDTAALLKPNAVRMNRAYEITPGPADSSPWQKPAGAGPDIAGRSQCEKPAVARTQAGRSPELSRPEIVMHD